MFFLKNNAEKEAWRLLPDLLLFFKKALYKVKAIGLQLHWFIASFSFVGFTTFRYYITVKYKQIV